MAESDITASPVRAVPLNCDKIDDLLLAAAAIVDCVRVLAALERAPRDATAIGLALGNGLAGGEQARDASMPMALYHAMNLVEEARGLVGAAT